MNPAHKSKINYTALTISCVGVVAGLDLIAPEVEEHMVEIVMIVLPPLIVIFRTWFTGGKYA